jgi:ATP-dependent DNA ligase
VIRVSDRHVPELDGLADAVDGRSMTLDGELVVFDDHGVPRFERPQHRIGRAAAQQLAVFRAVLVVFDLLDLDCQPILRLPWSACGAALDDLHLTIRTRTYRSRRPGPRPMPTRCWP